jgi:hypothetical protein
MLESVLHDNRSIILPITRGERALMLFRWAWNRLFEKSLKPTRPSCMEILAPSRNTSLASLLARFDLLLSDQVTL